MSEKSKKLLKNAEDFKFGKIKLDNNLFYGLLLLIAVIFVAFLLRKIIEEWVENILLFVLLFAVITLITKNVLYAAIGAFILYFIFKSLMNTQKKIEKFENEMKEKDEESDKEDKKKNKLEDTNLNIEQSPITNKEKNDLDMAAKNMEKFSELLQGGIKLKDDDLNETKPLDMNFKDSKYSKEGNSPLKQAQMETYQLMDTMKNLQDTINTLSPVLQEGKKVMDMFNNFKLE